jgi:hypothetical protein
MSRMIFSVITDFSPRRDKPVQFGVSIPLIHKQLILAPTISGLDPEGIRKDVC